MTSETPANTSVGFARALRSAGLDVPVGSVTAYVEGLAAVGIGRTESVYWAGRATLVRRPEDIPLYDEVFSPFWLGRSPSPTKPEQERSVDVETGEDGDQQDPDGATDSSPVAAVRYSPRETLRHKDFAAYSKAEFAEARKLMADMRLAGALRRSRRVRPSTRGGSRPDVRRTVRSALRTGAEPLCRRSLARARSPRRVVLLCDVSGSMEPYTRALLRFLHAAVAGRSGVEAFVFATELTRITRQLACRDPDAALDRAGATVADWSGGTRLGEVLREFNARWSDVARGAVVVVLSDGWDRGDPTALTLELDRLRRRAHRIVWVNPLKASPGYAPLARGMAAALPYVDDFVEGHSLAAMEQLVDVIGK
jgi:uncharacterized protein with von Willebrand factor type A (vWA) domain